MTDTTLDLRRHILGFRISQSIHVAAALNVSDHLQAGPRTVAELAAATLADESSLRRLLRALAALAVYTEDPVDTFACTPMGAALASDHPSGLRDIAANVGRPYLWGTWGHLVDSVRTGANAFQSIHDMSVWEYRANHPDDSDAFDRGMAAITRPVAAAVAASYDVQAGQVVVDVGGGTGALLATILAAHPGVRGVLFDQPPVVAAAPQVLADAGIADQCEIVGGSFLDGVPDGGDVYLLKSVIHDWEDDDSVAILRIVRAAMAPTARCVLIERLLAGPNQGLETALSDLNMLVMPGGRERSLDEFERLFAAAGLRLSRSIATGTDFHLIEAIPA